MFDDVSPPKRRKSPQKRDVTPKKEKNRDVSIEAKPSPSKLPGVSFKQDTTFDN
jgi:hypothetical protein